MVCRNCIFISVGIIVLLQLVAVAVVRVTSLQCASCSNAHRLEGCTGKTTCEDGEVCFMSSYTSHRFSNGEARYHGGCGLEYDRCERRSGWLLNRFSHVECCDSGDFCNRKHAHTAQKVTTEKPKPTAFRLSKGIDCEVCSGQECGVTENKNMLQCPDDFPYCMNVVQSDSSGNKLITKSCATFSECNNRWLEDSALRSVCITLDPSNIYRKTFECTYCCETAGCNKLIVPLNETLLIGTM